MSVIKSQLLMCSSLYDKNTVNNRVEIPRDFFCTSGAENRPIQVGFWLISLSILHRSSRNKDEGQAFIETHLWKLLCCRENVGFFRYKAPKFPIVGFGVNRWGVISQKFLEVQFSDAFLRNYTMYLKKGCIFESSYNFFGESVIFGRVMGPEP